MEQTTARQWPSPKQLNVLKFLVAFQQEHGFCPSMEEIGQSMGVTKVTVYQHISALEHKGFLTRLRNQARSLRVTPQAEQLILGASPPRGSAATRTPTAAHFGGRSATTEPQPSASLPLLGSIAAGRPIDVYESAEEVNFDEFFQKREKFYALKVRGESMIEDHIRDGDYVIVESRRDATQGETVVARLPNGEVTLKRFYREGKGFRLQPANSRMKPIYANEVDIVAVVVGLMRRY